MKKLLSIALAVVMVLGVASVAMALDWSKPVSTITNDNFGYKVDVVKYTLKNGSVGTNSVEPNDAATAVNGADVYFVVKLSVNSPSDSVKDTVAADIEFTALAGLSDFEIPNQYMKKESGEYFLVVNAAGTDYGFYKIDEIPAGYTHIFAAKCLDTETVKAEVKVTAKRPLDSNPGDVYANSPFTWNGYTVSYFDNFGKSGIDYIRFEKSGDWIQFSIDGDGVAKRYEDSGNFGDASFEWNLYTALGIDPAMLSAGSVFMTEDNLLSNFGFSYSSSDSATWAANSTPIILDPIVSIPKTGDNASVIGFAMIMVAIVAAAVAVKKVRA